MPLDVFLGFALLAATLLAFSPALSADFVRWDDPTFVTENQHVHALTPANLWWMLTAFHGGHFHPLTWLTFAIDYEIWGPDRPWGFHLTNILIHAVNSVLLFLLARRLIRLGIAQAPEPATTLCAALAAALWAVHPLRVESVAWVTERRDVLSTMFLLAATLAYLRSVDVGSAHLRSWRAYALCIALTALACLSKGWGMIFFLIPLALDFYPLRRLLSNPLNWFSRPALRIVAEKTPLILLGLATAYLAASASHTSMAVKTLAQWGLRERTVQALYGLWFYFKATFVPTGLSPLYQLPIRIEPSEPRYIAAYIFVIFAAVFVIWSWKRLPAIVTAAAIYVGVLLPVLGFLQSGEQFVADRYSYIATMPLFILAGAGALRLMGCHWQLAASGETSARKLAPETPSRAAAVLTASVSVVLLLSLTALTFAQTSIWRNTESLWSYASTVTPTSQVLNSLALELEREGRRDEAIRVYELATRVNPTDGRAWFTYANIMRDAGNLKEAEAAYKQAALHLPQAYQAYQNLGILYQKHGHIDAAIEMYRLAVADVEKGGHRPLSGGPYMTLALALAQQGKKDEAEAALRKALAFEDTREAAAKELQALGK